MVATLLREGSELGQLEDFETWVETHHGQWARRCLFNVPAKLHVDPREVGLMVRLNDGTTWDLAVQRAVPSSGKVHVTSAVLQPPRAPAAA